MRLLISKLLATFLLSSLFLSADSISRTKVSMGTFVTISLEKHNKNYIEKAFDIIYDVENSLSSYKSKALISQLNQNKKVKLDTYTYEALDLSKHYHKLSDGYFDITIGSITKDLYKFGEDEVIPSHSKLQEAFVDFKGLSFNKKEAFIKHGMKIDLGGMGKGFAVDQVVQYLKSKDIDKGIIVASGDIHCLDICNIDVDDPFSEGKIISFVTKDNDTSISTSGNYNRYVSSTKHNHLINPKKKESQKNFVSITLISKISNSDLDAFATTASVMPVEKAYEFLNVHELAYIIVQSDKNIHLSDNISNYVKNLVMYDRIKQ